MVGKYYAHLPSWDGKIPTKCHLSKSFVVHEHTSHPSKTQNLTPYNIVVDSYQMTLHRLFQNIEAKSGVKSTTLNKVLDKYQFIRASCGFNETCSHNIPLPISSTTRDLSRRLCELIHHGWRGCSRTKPPTKLRQDSFQLDSTRLIRILRCHLRSQIAPKESFTWPNITPLRSHLRSQQASFLCRELKSLAPRLLLTLPLPIVFDLYLKPFNRMLSVPARHSPLNVVLSGCVCDSLEICYDFQATTITHEWIHGVYVDVHATYS